MYFRLLWLKLHLIILLAPIMFCFCEQDGGGDKERCEDEIKARQWTYIPEILAMHLSLGLKEQCTEPWVSLNHHDFNQDLQGRVQVNRFFLWALAKSEENGIREERHIFYPEAPGKLISFSLKFNYWVTLYKLVLMQADTATAFTHTGLPLSKWPHKSALYS